MLENTIFMKIFFKNNISIQNYNTFGLDAKVDYFVEPENIEELKAALKFCADRKLKFFILGGGSNIIFNGDYHGMVIHLIECGIERCGDILVASAGVVWDDLVSYSVEQGLQGLENLSAIPGSVGAAPVQNIGAYGAESGDWILWVEYLDTQTMEVCRIDGRDCEFGYRDSIFKRSLGGGRAVILRVAFKLNTVHDFRIGYGDLMREVELRGGESLENIRAAVIAIRASKLPDPSELGNAGSFFKNPIVDATLAAKIREKHPDLTSYNTDCGVKIPAGWLIDRAGWKGFRDGAVGVHDRQALVIVNYGGATATQILELASKIQEDIRQRFGIDIDMEVNVL